MDVSKLKVAEIKKELKDRGLNTVGNKQELVTRLQEALDAEVIGQDDDENLNGSEDAVVDEVEEIKEEDQAKKEEKQSRKIVLNRTDFPDEPVAEIQSTGEKTETAEAGIKKLGTLPLTSAERLALRAKRFGSTETTTLKTTTPEVVVAAAPDQTSQPAAKKAKVELSEEQLEVLRKRAERFGMNVSPLVQSKDADEKKKQREERFSTATPTVATADTTEPAVVTDLADVKILTSEERKRLRAERFKQQQ
ncbi:SAP domain-containing ribonucleoprotein isoform X2 [Neocloeon triangulifer]|uniref:SAP domain-containing ribonucleoprotein isoform X2 n=1 Tax=Neocloeon triangulifer TaxID=2078957 RepID=UPI00286F8369|nr:SAP domain-containing ribonucleoprotein isoform X2 [Neocloeon triangulifer]